MGPAVFLYVVKLIDDRGGPSEICQVKTAGPIWVFKASFLILLPEVLLTILIES